MLVDVRSAPYSRYVPHFNKAALETYLKDNGLDYRYAGDYLGGRPKDESVYTSNEEDTKRPNYLTIMQTEWYRKGIARLLQIVTEARAAGGNVTIMCSEGDPLNCHRHHLIARSLLDPAVRFTDTPIQLIHILKDGAAHPISPDLFITQDSTPHQPRLL